MASPPICRDEFAVGIVCALPVEYNAVVLLFDHFWDKDGDTYGRAVGDTNFYTTGRMAKFNVVLVLLHNMGKVSSAGAAASLGSSYPNLSLILLVGVCGGVPKVATGEEILLGDVVISKSIVQYDLGRKYPDGFFTKDANEIKPAASIRGFVSIFETEHKRKELELRAAVLLEQMQNRTTDNQSSGIYQYLGSENDKLFQASYRHKHHTSEHCFSTTCHHGSGAVCEESRKMSCAELGCDSRYLVQRERLQGKKQQERDVNLREAQRPSLFIGRIGSGDTVFKSGDDRDQLAKQHSILAFEMEGAGLFDGAPCIIVKGVCDYADSHKNKSWQDFAAATAACVARGLVERWPQTDAPSAGIRTSLESTMDVKENRECLRDLRRTDPRDDKTRIEETKGGLLRDSYCWILDHDHFRQWRDDPLCRLLWIKGDAGKGKTMLLCGITNEIENGPRASVSYFFCQATEERLNNGISVLQGLIYILIVRHPSLISYVREKYDHAGKQLFEDGNAWSALSKILKAILQEPCVDNEVLIVDALDECVDGLPRLLDLITEISSSCRAKWIISSRNWPSIEEKLNDSEHGIRLCLEENMASISQAVKTYIRYKVQLLARRKKYDGETKDMVENHLISNANATFLWVALVCQELLDSKVRKHNTRAKLTSFPPRLEALYHQMLEHVYDSDDAGLCQHILAVVLVVHRPISLQELKCLVRELQKHDDDDVHSIVGLCGSFVNIRDARLYLVHQSAQDFFTKRQPDELFPYGTRELHNLVLSRSFTIMSETLRRNIYDLEDPGSDIHNLKRPNPDPLAGIAYSCVYWADHVYDANTGGTLENAFKDDGAIHSFLKEDYLYWLEALSLLGQVSKGAAAMQHLKTLLMQVNNSCLLALVQDGLRFLLSCRTVLEIAPLQIYTSGLLFSPSSSLIKGIWQKCLPDWVTLKPDLEDDWSACLLAVDVRVHMHRSLGFSPSGHRLTFLDGDSIKVLDVTTGSYIQTIGNLGFDNVTVVFSKDEQSLISCAKDGTIKVWHIPTGTDVRTIKGHTSTVTAITLFAGGQRLASASGDGTVKIWDLATGRCLQTFKVPTSAIFGIAVSSDGQNIALIAHIGTTLCVFIWNLSTKVCRQIPVGRYTIGSEPTALSPDGNKVAIVSGGNTIEIWDISTGSCLQILKDTAWMTFLLEFSPTNQNIASVSEDMSIKIWDLATGCCLQTLLGHTKEIYCIAFSMDGQRLASAACDDTIRVWNLALDIGQNSKGIIEDCNVSVFSADGQLIATTSRKKATKIWDAATGSCLQTCEGHLPEVFSPYGQLLALTDGKAVKLWDIATESCLQTVFEDGPSWRIGAIAFSTDCQQLAFIHKHMIKVWDLVTARCLHTLGPHDETLLWSGSLTFSKDGKQLASADMGIIKTWDLSESILLQTLKLSGRGEDVISLTFSADDQQLATSITNGAIIIWDLARGAPSRTLHVGRPLGLISFDPILNNCLHTDMGVLDLNEDEPIGLPLSGYGISSDYAWIIKDGKNLLWLPQQFRPRTAAVAGSTVAIGCVTGRLLILHFMT